MKMKINQIEQKHKLQDNHESFKKR